MLKLNKIFGVPLSSGFAMGNVFKIENSSVSIALKQCSDTENEKKRVKKAIIEATEHQKQMIEKFTDNSTVNEILITYLYMINDPDLLAKIYNAIDNFQCSAEYAVKTAFDNIIFSVKSTSNEYIQSRSQDIYGIMKKIINFLQNNIYEETELYNKIKPNTILACKYITPVILSKMKMENIIGIITTESGPASHLAVVSKSLQIPTVSCSKENFEKISNNIFAVVDGNNGNVITDISNEEKCNFEKILSKLGLENQSLQRFATIKATTADGFKLPVQANVSRIDDVDTALKNGAEGIGLIRTETLFNEFCCLPDIHIQREIYKEIIDKCNKNSVIFRTFDLSSDKDFYGITNSNEENPELGERGIRFGLKNKNILKNQIKAIMTASGDNNVGILVPFVSDASEIKLVKEEIEKIKKELESENIDYNHKIKIGAMIEIPSAALSADEIADECDFLSIGTNDLTQFTLAADRANSNVSYIYNPLHKSVLKLIKMTAQAGKNKNIPVCVCGEMASNPLMLNLLIGFGITKVSVSPSKILAVKNEISKINYYDCFKKAEKHIH